MDYRDAFVAAQLAWLLGIALLDIRTLRAPNRIVYPSIGLGVLGALPLGTTGFISAVTGGLLAFVILAAIVLAGRGRMGAGDAKVGAMAGMTVGAAGVPAMLAAAFVSGAVVASAVLLLRLRERRDVLAFTPLLLLGCVFVLARA